MANLLDSAAIEAAMKKVPSWDQDEASISRTFEFEDYMDGIQFVNQVAEIAEDSNHHPEMEIRYGWVDVSLSTHDSGGLTQLDFDVAEKIDTLVD